MKVLAEIEGGSGWGNKHKEALNPVHMPHGWVAGWEMQNSSAARRFFVPTEYIVTAVK